MVTREGGPVDGGRVGLYGAQSHGKGTLGLAEFRVIWLKIQRYLVSLLFWDGGCAGGASWVVFPASCPPDGDCLGGTS